MWARRVFVTWSGLNVFAFGKLQFFPYRLNLVFDLDATLIDTTHEKEAPGADVHISFSGDRNYSVWFRPHVRQVLNLLKRFNSMYMFTAATRSYTDSIVSQLVSADFFDEILYRDSLVSFMRRKHHRVSRETSFSKDLTRLSAIRQSGAIERSVLIDDKSTNQVGDQHIIVVHPFDVSDKSWSNDVELLRVAGLILLCNLGGEEVTRRLLQEAKNR